MKLYAATLEVVGDRYEFIEEGDDLIPVLMLYQERAERINKALLEKFPDLEDEALCKVTGVALVDTLRFTEEWASTLIKELVID